MSGSASAYTMTRRSSAPTLWTTVVVLVRARCRSDRTSGPAGSITGSAPTVWSRVTPASSRRHIEAEVNGSSSPTLDENSCVKAWGASSAGSSA